MALCNNIGIVVIEALKSLNEPATLDSLISKTANMVRLSENEVRHSVIEAAKAGVRLGYIQRSRRKFVLLPLHIEDSDSWNGFLSNSKIASVSNVSKKEKVPSKITSKKPLLNSVRVKQLQNLVVPEKEPSIKSAFSYDTKPFKQFKNIETSSLRSLPAVKSSPPPYQKQSWATKNKLQKSS